MPSPPFPPLALPTFPRAWSPTRITVRRPVKTLFAVSVVGVTVSACNWRTAVPGVGWFLADLVLVAALLAGFARGRPGLSGWILAAANLILGAASCGYASDWALFTAAPGTAATLALLAVVVASRTSPLAIDRVGQACADALRGVPGGVLDAARVPMDAVGPHGRTQGASALRGALVGAPLGGLFVLLLSGDEHFRDAAGDLARAFADGVEFIVWAGATTATLLVGTLVLRALRRKREVERVSSRPTPTTPYRTEASTTPGWRAGHGARVGPVTWGVVLAHVLLVFAVYAFVNLRSLFVGHSLMRARGTVTYAEYLHEGFAQVSLATCLAVTCVVAGHVLTRPRGRLGEGGGRFIVGLELGLLALVAVALASCAHRLGLYEAAYGSTYLRLGVRLFQLGIAGLLAMTAARCLARTWRGWGAAVTWAAIAFTVIAGSIDADGWIAHRNVEQAMAGARLDVAYLATLSEDARRELAGIAAVDPAAAAELARIWADKQEERRDLGWRAWRGL